MTTLFRGPVQDAQVLPGVPRAVRVDPRRPPLLRGILGRLQPRASSRRARAAHAGVGLLRHRSPDPSPPRDRARSGLRGQPAAVRPPADPAPAARHRLDQPAHLGGAHTDEMTARCLTGLESFRASSTRQRGHDLRIELTALADVSAHPPAGLQPHTPAITTPTSWLPTPLG